MSFFQNNEENDFNNYCQQCVEYKNKLTDHNHIWISINIDDIIIGDEIFVEYTPDSLKNLYELTSECGKVVNIQLVNCIYKTNNKYTDIFIINHLNQQISIYKGWLGMYSSGYDISICKKIHKINS